MGLCFMLIAQVKPSYHKRKREKLPVDLLMVTEQSEPLHEPLHQPLHETLHLPCLPCVLHFCLWHQIFHSPDSKGEVIVSLMAHKQQLISIKLLTVLGDIFLILLQHSNEYVPF